MTRGAVLASILAVGTVAGAAAPPQPSMGSGKALPMDEAVTRALQWHPLLRSARAQILQAGEGIDAARAGYYPQVSFGVNSQVSNYDISGYDSQNVYRADLSVSQLLYDFGRIGSQVDRAQAVQGTTQVNLSQVAAEVIRNTTNAWLQVRNYEALMALALKRLDAIKALAQLAHQRAALGASTQADTTQARARVEAAQLKLVTARAQVRRWRTELKHWVGSASLPNVAGAPLSALKHACVAAEGADFAEPVAVQAARARLAVARAGVDVAQTQLRPTLSLNATAGRGLGADSRRIGEDAIGTAITLDVSMPLFQGGRLRSNTDAAQYGVAAAQAVLAQARLASDRGLQTAVVQWRQNAELQDIEAARIDSMSLTRTLYRRQYLQLGTRSLLDLLNAEQEYYDVLSAQIQTRYDMYRLGVDCLYYSGQLHKAFAGDGAADAFSDSGRLAGHTDYVISPAYGQQQR